MAFRYSFSVGFMARQEKPDKVTQSVLRHFASIPLKSVKTASKKASVKR